MKKLCQESMKDFKYEKLDVACMFLCVCFHRRLHVCNSQNFFLWATNRERGGTDIVDHFVLNYV